MSRTIKAKNGSLTLSENNLHIQTTIREGNVVYSELAKIAYMEATKKNDGMLDIYTTEKGNFRLKFPIDDNKIFKEAYEDLCINNPNMGYNSINQNNTQQNKKLLKGCLVSLIVTIGILTVSLFVFFYQIFNKDAEFDDISAMTHSQSVVKDYLNAPTTAKFPWSVDDYTIKIEDNRAIVSGWVEAENLLGGRIKNTYTAIFDFRVDKKDVYFTDLYIQIQDDVYLNLLN